MNQEELNSILELSIHDRSFAYANGMTVEPEKPFDENRWKECASGIHFYITRIEAVHH